MKTRSGLPYLLTLALSAATFLQLHAQTITVTTADDENGNNLTGDISLREAITHSTPDSLIIFDPTLSGETITLSSGEQLSIDKSLTIDASSLPNGIAIDANGAATKHRIMTIDTGVTVTLLGLTLTGGNASGNNFPDSAGGAIYSDGATLSLRDCTLAGNLATFEGGAIYSDGSSTANSTLTLNDCTLTANSAKFGGAIYGDGFDGGNSTLTLTACTLAGNYAASEGGAIYSDGFDLGNSTLTLNDCTLTANSSSLFGGAIFSDGSGMGNSTLTLSACTLAANSATSEGGAIYSDGFAQGNSTLSLSDSILANNTSAIGLDLREIGEITEAFTTAIGNNLMSSIAGSNIATAPPEITIINATDLLLSPLGDYGGLTQTMIPLDSSPAIDAAINSTRTQDQRGFPITGDAPDIGAAESQGSNNLASLWNTDSDGDGTPFGVEFALGTDPLVSDPNHPNNMVISFEGNGNANLSFGSNPNAIGQVIWIIERSTDLKTWATLFSTTSPSSITNVVDDSARTKAYYRFRAEQQ